MEMALVPGEACKLLQQTRQLRPVPPAKFKCKALHAGTATSSVLRGFRSLCSGRASTGGRRMAAAVVRAHDCDVTVENWERAVAPELEVHARLAHGCSGQLWKHDLACGCKAGCASARRKLVADSIMQTVVGSTDHARDRVVSMLVECATADPSSTRAVLAETCNAKEW